MSQVDHQAGVYPEYFFSLLNGMQVNRGVKPQYGIRWYPFIHLGKVSCLRTGNNVPGQPRSQGLSSFQAGARTQTTRFGLERAKHEIITSFKQLGQVVQSPIKLTKGYRKY